MAELPNDVDALRRIVLERSAKLENYSIDESFLNLAGFERKGIEAYAHTIRRCV